MELEYYGGFGFEQCPQREDGDYRVKYNEAGVEIEKDYASFTKAKRFYDKIKGEKAFWWRHELVDCWTVKEDVE